MAGYVTDVHVASQTAHELIVVVPPVSSNWVWIVGLLTLILGYAVIFLVWKTVPRPASSLLRLVWLIPLAIAAPFLILGGVGQVKTQITLSADRNTMDVQKTVMSLPISSKEYPFSEVRGVKVGVADITRFLYVDLMDRPAEDLTSATDQTGYSEAADVMNVFLRSNRR